ncbi:MAG: thioredoxin [Myxococcales bacterium]|nr:thioredoxin [Myxococcales bacterium]
MAGDNVCTFTDQNFDDEVINSNQPVLVDFWASWCGPCVRLGPTIESLADDYTGKIKIGKLDVENNPATAGRFRVTSIPMVVVFQQGQPVEMLMGLRPKSDYESVLERLSS